MSWTGRAAAPAAGWRFAAWPFINRAQGRGKPNRGARSGEIDTTRFRSRDPTEIARFDRLAGHWWDPAGPMRPLHRMNPVRLGYIREQACRHLALDAAAIRPFGGIRALDIGCGAGLLAEPLARLGATVTGIDPASEALAVASHRSREQDLGIDYRPTTAEALAGEGRIFDLVCVLEVVEHVAEPDAFLTTCARLVRPGGVMVLSTLNRTARAFALGIVGAEYLMRWLPRGTHSWQRFLKPSEVARPLRRAGAEVVDVSGVTYDPLRDRWRLGSDVRVNYLMTAVVHGRS